MKPIRLGAMASRVLSVFCIFIFQLTSAGQTVNPVTVQAAFTSASEAFRNGVHDKRVMDAFQRIIDDLSRQSSLSTDLQQVLLLSLEYHGRSALDIPGSAQKGLAEQDAIRIVAMRPTYSPDPHDPAFATFFESVRRSRVGRIQWSVTPIDAEIRIDNYVMFGSDLTRTLAVGRHSITATRNGYTAFDGDVDVLADQTSHTDIRLKLLSGPTTPDSAAATMPPRRSGSGQTGAPSSLEWPPPDNSSTEVVGVLNAFYSAIRARDRATGVRAMTEAITRGIPITLLVQHDHRNLRIHYLTPGSLTIGRDEMVFTSYFGEDSFAASWTDVAVSLSRPQANAPDLLALSIRVQLRDSFGKPKNRRDFKFFTTSAQTTNGDVQCAECGEVMGPLADVFVSVQDRARRITQNSPVVTGTYLGNANDSTGRRNMLWIVEQVGTTVQGIVRTVGSGGQASDGQISGVVTGSSITFTLSIPAGSQLYPCAAELSGAARVTTLAIQATYSGKSSCTEQITEGRFVVVRGKWPER